MPGDFDKNISTQKCCDHIAKHSYPGSIIVLHENEKSKLKVLPILEWVLAHYSQQGYTFKGLDSAKL